MEAPSSRARDDWRAQLGDAGAHQRLLAELACLHQVDLHPSEAPVALSGWIRVAAWNVQRGRRPAAVAAALRSAGAELSLLSELDDGMARTQNLDAAGCIARDLGAGSAFGVEFVELGLGDEHEQRAAAGATNERGLHGNAVIAAALLEDAAVVRLPDVGVGWFAADSTQPRVGGRMAVLAAVHVDGTSVQIASTHLENRTEGAHRAEQMEALLRAVEARANGGPAIVGGDCNTLGADYVELFDRSRVRAMRVEDPTRFTWPVAYEPLFEVAQAYGYGWTDANVAAPTTEHDAGGLPDHVPIRLDWLFVRGLVARRPAVVAGGWPLGPSHGQRRRAAPVSVLVRPAERPADEENILAVVSAAFADDTRDATEELAIVRGTWAAGAARVARRAGGRRVRLGDRARAGRAGPPRRHALRGRRRGAGLRGAVAPGARHRHRAHARARGRGRGAWWPLLVLLGEPAFYGRVGFGAAASLGIHYAPVGPDSPHFLARRLGGASTPGGGEFTYCWERG